MEISGRSALIVGGASGMARATAEQFVAKGGRVAILDLPKSAGADTAKLLGGMFYPCDVTDFAGAEAVVRQAAGELGGVHFCVNTAGGGVAMRTLAKDGPAPARRVPPRDRPEPGRELQRGAHRRRVA